MRLIDADVLKQHIDKLPALPDGNFAGNHSALKALINMQPTIEPSANCSEIPNNSATISRTQAIDAMDSEMVSTNPEHFNSSEKFIKFMDDADIASFGKWQWANGFNTGVVAAKIQLKKLPSAQPEIIRCRECKHRDEYGCCKQWKGLLMSAIPIATDDDDFCSYAKR